MNESKKVQFPIEGASSCPKCGSEERIGQKVIHELKEEGKLSERAFKDERLVIQIPLLDQTRPPLVSTFTMPVLCIYFDVCEECKSFYCTGVDLVQQTVQVQSMPSMGKFGNPKLR